jgi:hypothetical protein
LAVIGTDVDGEQRADELAHLRMLITAWRTAQDGGGDIRRTFDELVAGYREATAVRRFQALDDAAEELSPGRDIYTVRHELGGTKHDRYLTRNGRWRGHRAHGGGTYQLQRLFGGRHTIQGGHIVEVEAPLLVVDVGGRGTNIDRLEHALRIDIRDGLWPPAHLRTRYRGLVEQSRGRTAEGFAPTARTYARLEDDGEVDIYCIVAPGGTVQGEALRLNPELPLAKALNGAAAGDRISWRSPSGERSARVLAVGGDLVDVLER